MTTSSPASAHNQIIGGAMHSGSIRSLRANGASFGIIAVSAGPPGTTTFIRQGVRAMLADAPEGVATIEGTEPRD